MCFLFVMYRGTQLAVYKSWRKSRKRVFGQQLNLSRRLVVEERLSSSLLWERREPGTGEK